MSQLDPIVNAASLYMNGLLISNNATTPNTKLDIAAGQCRDSNNMIDMLLGDYLAQGYGSDNAATVLNMSVNGLNGLDTGSIAASTVYAIYVIADSSNKNPTGVIASTNASAPYLPAGYDSIRLIGFWATDASSHFLKGYMYGFGNDRTFKYDAPQATAVTAGNATSYTAVALTEFVPALENLPVSFAFAFTPGAAGRAFNLTPGNATGNALTITGQVTSVVVSGVAEVLSKVSAGVPEVDYKVANSGDAVAINVAGYRISL